MDWTTMLIAMSIPSAFTGFCFWLLERNIAKQNKKQEEREAAREKCELYIVKGVGAAIALGEATATAVQRIPDAHCNGDMHAALEYARQVKHEQKDFLSEQALKSMYSEV